jgi:DNA topoisomerase-2
MYSCFKKNLTNEMKVAQLAAYVAETSAYHHGEVSLADTIVKLAHNFTGSNNINLLEPCGQFGTRLMGGKDASQTRYIFTKLTKDARKLFDAKDDAVLKYLDDDGKPIEPEYYVPILPTVLVNGTEGIGTGFSCYVPPFNPKDICENIERAISNQPLKEMKPWFSKFKGRVFKNTDGFWVTEGLWSTTSTGNKIKITELPPGRWTQDYKEYLDGLVDKKVIASFVNNSTTEDVDFTITGYTGKDIIKDFKLQKSFHVSNMHLFHPTKGIKKYASPEEILVDFMEIRMGTYQKRKEHLLHVLKEKTKKLENMSRFVDAVINEKIVVFKRKKSELEAEISKTFDKIDDSYDYLLNIKTYQYTKEAVQALNEETGKTKKELEDLNATSHLDMWKMDLKIYKQ